MAFNLILRKTLISPACLKANTRIMSISMGQPALKKKEIKVIFLKPNGDTIKTKGQVGDTLLDVVTNNDIDLDGFGACDGTLACSTCHLIFKQEDFDSLPYTAKDEELDMLEMAYDLTDTSRLGCQVTLSENMNELEVKLPSTVNDARSE